MRKDKKQFDESCPLSDIRSNILGFRGYSRFKSISTVVVIDWQFGFRIQIKKFLNFFAILL